MITQYKIPELGENIESGDVTQVLVAAGDRVDKDQTLMEVEAGKANMEIPAPVAGVVKAVHVAVGDTVKTGQLVVEIEGGGEESPAQDAASRPEEKPTSANDETTGSTEIAEAAPEPVSAEPGPVSPVPAPESEVSDDDVPSVEEKAGPEPGAPESQAYGVSAAPNVRRLARELGVDIHRVPSSGPHGYITAEDVKEFAKNGLKGGFAFAGATRVEKMSAARKATLKHMVHCWETIPHVTQHDVADITKLEALRKQYAPRAEAAGAKLTMTAVIIKVLSSALKKFPKFNCSIDPEKEQVIYKGAYNIGIAMDTPKGLLVPVIRDGDQKNMVELALELRALAEKARAGKLTAGDLKGGTFTFTNLGIIGGSFFTPIVNSPEVAILGSGRAHWEPGVEDGSKHFRLPLSLSYDHRIIDGADGARFLKWVIDAMEEPLLLSLEG